MGSRPTNVAVGGGAVWVLNGAQATLSRIDPHSGVVTTLGLGTGSRNEPWAIAFAEGSVWAQVGDGVSRLNPETTTTIGTFDLGHPRGPIAVGDGALWYVETADLTLQRVDLSTGRDSPILDVPVTPDAEIAVGAGAVWVAVGGPGAPTNPLLRVDPATDRQVGQITLPNGSISIALSPRAVWLASAASGTVTKIDPSTGAVAAVMRIGGHPGAIAADGSSVWVADPLRGTVTRIDATGDRVVTTIHVGQGITGIAIGEGGVWVTVNAS